MKAQEINRIKAVLMHLRQAKFRLDAAAAYSDRVAQKRLNTLTLQVEQEIQDQARLLPDHTDDVRWQPAGADGAGFPAHNPNPKENS